MSDRHRYRRILPGRLVRVAAVTGCLVAAGGIAATSAAAFQPTQTTWTVIQANGKIVWTLESVPFDYLGYRSASGDVTERWHALGHGSDVSFPFTSLRPLASPSHPVYSFPIRPIAGTLSGHGEGQRTDGSTGGCSSNLARLPNNAGRNATLNMATIDRHHLAVWTTAENPTDLLTTEPCATRLGNISPFPTAQPDQQHKPDVRPTPISILRIDPSDPANRNKRVHLHLSAEYNLVVTTTDGKRHVVGTETTTTTLILELHT